MTNEDYELMLYLKTQRLINEYADKIREIYDIQIPITNIDEVVVKIGGEVKYDSNYNSYIEKTMKGFTIHVENNNNAKIKKFRVAQELGKLFLYTDFISDQQLFEKNDNIVFKASYYKDGAINWINEFAGALLMPKDNYIREVNKNTNDNIVDTKIIAQYFDVSISSASWRGKRLQILKD